MPCPFHFIFNFSMYVTGLPLYGVMGIGGYFVGSVLHQYKLKRILTREVYLWDYIKQHPEDFPELGNLGAEFLCYFLIFNAGISIGTIPSFRQNRHVFNMILLYFLTI